MTVLRAIGGVALAAASLFLLASCAGPATDDAATEADAPAAVTPAESIQGTWNCTGFVDGQEQDPKATFNVSADEVEILVGDFRFVADYTIVGDTLTGTSTSVSEGGGTPGGTGNIENFPVVLPEAGQKVDMRFEPEGNQGFGITAYLDEAGTLFYEVDSDNATAKCVRG